MDQQKLYFLASDVSLTEQQSCEQFVKLTFCLFSTRLNRNGQGVTEAFIDEIVQNPTKYLCTPLRVDKHRLLAHDFSHLGHMYDPDTGKFNTDQIGGFASFQKVVEEDGTACLYGEARVSKTDIDVCTAICLMYQLGILNVSFEICYVPEGLKIMDAGMYVDAHPSNVLTGMTIVTIPAHPEAVAVTLTAEAKLGEDEEAPGDGEENKTGDDPGKGVEKMEDNMIVQEGQAEAPEQEQNAPEQDIAIEPVAETEAPEVESEAPVAEVAVEPIPEEEPQPMVAEDLGAQLAAANEMIASLNEQISELQRFKAELDEIRAEEQRKEHEAKVVKATAYAQRLGLDPKDEAVATAIAELNYEALADIDMAKEEPKNNEDTQVAIASFAEMSLPGDNYGGLV